MADAIWNDRYILSNMTSEKLYAKSPLTTGVSGTSAYIGLETEYPVYGTETYAGKLNGKDIYQQFVSATWSNSANEYKDITFGNKITGTCVNSWVDPSNSYVWHGSNTNVMPISWFLGQNRYGCLFTNGSATLWVRMYDTTPANWTAFCNVKYFKE